MTLSSDKIEDFEDKIDDINMKLNELKSIQLKHDNLIKRIHYNFRYDILKIKSYNKIILKKRSNDIKDSNSNSNQVISNEENETSKELQFITVWMIIMSGIQIVLICGEYAIMPMFGYIYSQIF